VREARALLLLEVRQLAPAPGGPLGDTALAPAGVGVTEQSGRLVERDQVLVLEQHARLEAHGQHAALLGRQRDRELAGLLDQVPGLRDLGAGEPHPALPDQLLQARARPALHVGDQDLVEALAPGLAAQGDALLA
jgi:hypothetical protein